MCDMTNPTYEVHYQTNYTTEREMDAITGHVHAPPTTVEQLPTEILQRIFQYIDNPSQIQVLTTVNSHFAKILTDDMTWRMLAQWRFGAKAVLKTPAEKVNTTSVGEDDEDDEDMSMLKQDVASHESTRRGSTVEGHSWRNLYAELDRCAMFASWKDTSVAWGDDERYWRSMRPEDIPEHHNSQLEAIEHYVAQYSPEPTELEMRQRELEAERQRREEQRLQNEGPVEGINEDDDDDRDEANNTNNTNNNVINEIVEDEQPPIGELEYRLRRPELGNGVPDGVTPPDPREFKRENYYFGKRLFNVSWFDISAKFNYVPQGKYKLMFVGFLSGTCFKNIPIKVETETPYGESETIEAFCPVKRKSIQQPIADIIVSKSRSSVKVSWSDHNANWKNGMIYYGWRLLPIRSTDESQSENENETDEVLKVVLRDHQLGEAQVEPFSGRRGIRGHVPMIMFRGRPMRNFFDGWNDNDGDNNNGPPAAGEGRGGQPGGNNQNGQVGGGS